MGTEDKRGDPRTPFVLRVNFRDRSDCLDATENLSRGGLFVQTAERFSVGQRVELTVGFPGLLEPVALKGEVVWVRPSREDDRGRGRPPGGGRGRSPPAGRGAGRRASRTLTAPEGGFRVLLVEDNPLVVEMYSYVLKKLATAELRGKVPMEVHFAADGHAALQALAEDAFHLVLTDLYMPVMDGFALVQKMKSGSAPPRHPCRRHQRRRARRRVAGQSRRCGGVPPQAGPVCRGPRDGEAPLADQLSFLACQPQVSNDDRDSSDPQP